MTDNKFNYLLYLAYFRGKTGILNFHFKYVNYLRFRWFMWINQLAQLGPARSRHQPKSTGSDCSRQSDQWFSVRLSSHIDLVDCDLYDTYR